MLPWALDKCDLYFSLFSAILETKWWIGEQAKSLLSHVSKLWTKFAALLALQHWGVLPVTEVRGIVKLDVMTLRCTWGCVVKAYTCDFIAESIVLLSSNSQKLEVNHSAYKSWRQSTGSVSVWLKNGWDAKRKPVWTLYSCCFQMVFSAAQKQLHWTVRLKY